MAREFRIEELVRIKKTGELVKIMQVGGKYCLRYRVGSVTNPAQEGWAYETDLDLPLLQECSDGH